MDVGPFWSDFRSEQARSLGVCSLLLPKLSDVARVMTTCSAKVRTAILTSKSALDTRNLFLLLARERNDKALTVARSPFKMSSVAHSAGLRNAGAIARLAKQRHAAGRSPTVLSNQRVHVAES